MAVSPQTTSTSPPSALSLLDTPGLKTKDCYVVYHPRNAHFWWTNRLKQGFRHVEVAQPIYFGPGLRDVVWLHILPTFETLDVELATTPEPPWVRCPGSTVQKVTATRPLYAVRQWFHVGPISCVETVKMVLGINALFIRTPFQLYRYINRRGGVIINA